MSKRTAKSAEAPVIKIRDRIIAFERVPAADIIASPDNWRIHPTEQQAALKGILAEVGFAGAALGRKLSNGKVELIDGHLRHEQMSGQAVPVLITDLSKEEARKLLAVYDPLSAMAGRDDAKLAELLAGITTGDPGLQALLDQLRAKPEPEAGSEAATEQAKKTLSEKFLVPPFSVLDARQGYWQERKRAWLALGIKSEIGRGSTPGTSARAAPGEKPTYREIKSGDGLTWHSKHVTGEKLNYYRNRQKRGADCSPGGSARPAMDYSKRERGDGRGRPLKKSAKAPIPPA